MRIDSLPRYLWTKSPRDYWKKLTTRPADDFRPWAAGKHAQWARLYYYLHMLSRCATRAGHTLDFEGKQVLEIGAGPVLGVLPMALIEGAAGGAIIEPGYREVRPIQAFREDYLFHIYKTHGRIADHTHLASFDDFLRRIDALWIETRQMEDIKPDRAPYDVVISKSVFEHIANVPGAAKASRAFSSQGSLHLHYIDFTMHYERDQLVGNNFGRTYQQARADNPEYLANRDGIVNLLRASDMIAAFKPHFSEVHFFPMVDYKDRIDLSRLHPDWQRYTKDDLEIANGVLIAVA